MLVEWRRICKLLNTTITSSSASLGSQSAREHLQPPKTYNFSMNPFPGLIILLLGLMMSSHHQASMVSTIVDKQWCTLFVGFALARAVTYILTYLSPPTSYLPVTSTFRAHKLILLDLRRSELYHQQQKYSGSHGVARFARHVSFHGDNGLHSISLGLGYYRAGCKRMGGQEDAGGQVR